MWVMHESHEHKGGSIRCLTNIDRLTQICAMKNYQEQPIVVGRLDPDLQSLDLVSKSYVILGKYSTQGRCEEIIDQISVMVDREAKMYNMPSE